MMWLHDHCGVCGALLTPLERFSGGICGNWRCRAAKLSEALVAHRLEAAGALRISDPETYVPVVVPYRPRSIVRLSDERRTGFLNFIEKIISKAFQDGEALSEPVPDDDNVAPPLQRVALAEAAAVMVCAACAGVCCRHGGYSHAFLTPEFLRRLRSTRPDLTPEAVEAAYTTHLPETHLEGACVYQTLTGCALPRGLRAPICNGYQCRGLKEAVEKLAKNPAVRFIVIAREDNRIIRSAFVDASGIRRHPAA
ncbi:MAG: hypothetical protein V2B19_10635 [Pseudomonadota bacterium]